MVYQHCCYSDQSIARLTRWSFTVVDFSGTTNPLMKEVGRGLVPPIAMASSSALAQLDNSSASAQLDNFSALAIADEKIKYTVVGGRFSATGSIEPTSEVVILSVAGVNGSHFAFSAGSFKKTMLGGYLASQTSPLYKAALLLQPFEGGDWAYSTSIEGFEPGSRWATVSLMIGSQDGRAMVEVYRF